MAEERLTYTVDELAEILGVGRHTIYDHLSEKSLDLGADSFKVLRIGRRVVFPRIDVERVLGASA